MKANYVSLETEATKGFRVSLQLLCCQGDLVSTRNENLSMGSTEVLLKTDFSHE